MMGTEKKHFMQWKLRAKALRWDLSGWFAVERRST